MGQNPAAPKQEEGDNSYMYCKRGEWYYPLIPVETPSQIMDSAPYPKAAVQHIDDVLIGLDPHTAYFVKHVLHSQMVQKEGKGLDEGGFVPIPAEVRCVELDGTLYRCGIAEKVLPDGAAVVMRSDTGKMKYYGFRYDPKTKDADIEAAEAAGVLIVNPYDLRKGKARSYMVPRVIANQFVKVGTEERSCVKSRYNLFDVEKRIRVGRSAAKSKRRDSNGRTFSEVVLKGIDAITTRPFNRRSVSEEIGKLRGEVESAEWALRRADAEVADLLLGTKRGHDLNGDLEKVRAEVVKRYGRGSEAWSHFRDYERKRGRWITAYHCFEAVKRQGPVEAPEYGAGIWTYQAAYEPTSTGRISEKGGGFQNAPRRVQLASLQGVPAWHNYDISSCHDTLLKAEFERFGINDGGFFRWFENQGDGKAELARVIECSRETVKRCLHSLKMGARASKPFPRDGQRAVPSIYKYLRDDPGVGSPDVALGRFKAATESLREALTSWWDCAEREAWKRANGNQYGTFYKNACDRPFPMHRYQQKGGQRRLTTEGQRKLAAHILQGMEAFFVHTLAHVLSTTTDTMVVANMHDGLITLGEVPASAVADAMKQTGYTDIRFVQKPIL